MKKFFIGIGFFLAATAFKMWGYSPSQASSAKDEAQDGRKPNVIIILADDMGFGDVSAYGSSTISTPNIDAIASQGVCFNNGYAPSATSTPSRYGMLTGRYPWRNERARILDGDEPLIIDPDGFTLPKMLKDCGYSTAVIGKWHLGMGEGRVDWNAEITPGPREVGFDYSCVAAATNDRVPTVFVENGRVMNLDPADPIEVNYKTNFPGEPSAIDNPELVTMPWSHGHNQAVINGIPRIGYMKGGMAARWVDEDLADFYLDKAKEYVTENASRPFFLYYGLHQPHVPRTPHSRFVGATTMGPRGDAIVEADWCVGQLVSHLDSLGLLENTLIVFSSDNGPVLDDGYHDGAVEMVGEHLPTGGLRGGKYSLFDGGTHVPLMAWWKGHSVPGTSDALVCLVDMPATISQLAGGNIPEGLDSQNLALALLGETPQGRESLVFEATGRIGLRSGDWILIPPYKGRERNLTGNELGNMADYGLYNVADDPFQTTNVADQHPEILADLKEKLAILSAK